LRGGVHAEIPTQKHHEHIAHIIIPSVLIISV